jgi:transcriptional repressor NrdR
MKCPYCQTDNDKVIDSRSGEDGYATRRRRHCLSCDKRFTTYERVAELDIRVVKKDDSREIFQPEKIRNGIERACWKRPIATSEVARVIAEVIEGVQQCGNSEIESQEIGAMIMDRLIELDDVAYIRFASVYRQFKDINDFVQGVQPILSRNKIELQRAKNESPTQSKPR